MYYQSSQSLIGSQKYFAKHKTINYNQNKGMHLQVLTIQKNDTVWINAMFQYFRNNLESSQVLSAGQIELRICSQLQNLVTEYLHSFETKDFCKCFNADFHQSLKLFSNFLLTLNIYDGFIKKLDWTQSTYGVVKWGVKKRR